MQRSHRHVTLLAGSERAQRLAQYQTAMQYFGADGLGSVRQLFDASAVVVGSSRYDPFGNVMSQGGATSVFAFAGEQYDAATGLEYLRARYYSAAQGRFTTRDVWEGNIALPGTFDHWVYVRDNPVNYLDPSGQITYSESVEADTIHNQLLVFYQVKVQHDWGFIPVYYTKNGIAGVVPNGCWVPGAWKNVHELQLVKDAVERTSNAMGGNDKFKKAMKDEVVHINRWSTGWFSEWGSFAPPPTYTFLGDVVLPNPTFGSDGWAVHAVVHELAHVWDHRSDHKLSKGMMEALHTLTLGFWWDPYANPEVPAGAQLNCTVAEIRQGVIRNGINCGGSNVPYAYTYGGGGQLFEGAGWEDWADSVASFVYRDYYASVNQTNLAPGGIRENYVLQQINAVR